MKKTIILLTKSKKFGGYCTSGIDTETGSWIRIVSDGVGCNGDEITDSQLICENGEKAEIFDILEVECNSYRPTYFQLENFEKNRNIALKKVGRSNLRHVLALHPYEKKDYIFFNDSYKVDDFYIKQLLCEPKYSLMLIKVTDLRVEVKTWEQGKKGVTFSFSYNNVFYRYIRSTCGFEQQYFNYNDGIYNIPGIFTLVMSLGETFSIDSSHYKLIANVFQL